MKAADDKTPTAEERARIRKAATTSTWGRMMLRVLDALDTAERERDEATTDLESEKRNYELMGTAHAQARARIATLERSLTDEQRLRRVLDAARDAAERHVEKLEAEVAAAKAEAAACRFAFDNEHAAANAYSAEAERVTDELAEARANHANDLEHLGRVNELVDKARADLAAATRAQAELVAEARNHDEDLARVTGELADMTAAFRGELKVSDAALRRASDAEDALATSQRDREKLQGERDAALADLDRMNRRWDAAKPFVDAVLDVWDEAIGNRPNEYALKMEPPRVLAKFDRRLVRSMLAPVVEKFGELHDTFMEAEIDEQLRAAGGDPEAIGDRGAALVEKLLAARREAGLT